MPELPEVETIVRALRPHVVGRKVERVELCGKKNRIFRYLRRGADEVLGVRIVNVGRLGKHIVISLANKKFLILHLMMSGRILLDTQSPHIHDRLRIELSGSSTLCFRDPRKFGWCRIVHSSDALAGEDALAIPEIRFRKLLLGRKGAVKPFLLNQKFVSGIGNIYADEMLWYAGVHPARKCGSLDQGQIGKLYKAMRHVLSKGIKYGGTSSRDYQKPDGSLGNYYQVRAAYKRTGEKCRRDGAVIRRITVGQRATHFCPSHQN